MTEQIRRSHSGNYNRNTTTDLANTDVASAQSGEKIHLSYFRVHVETSGTAASEAKIFDGGSGGTLLVEVPADSVDHVEANPDPYIELGAGNNLTVVQAGDSSPTIHFEVGFYKQRLPSQ